MVVFLVRDRVQLAQPDLALNHFPDIATGDRVAFSQMYDAFAPKVLGLVTRVLRDRAQSEEVTQEIFLELWQSADRFSQAKGSPSSWVMTMAHRRAVDRVRASQASRDRDIRIGIRDHQIDYDSVAEVVELTVENERVKLALMALTPFQRTAITLTYYEGLTFTEVADKLDLPVATVKTRLRDGLIRLRKLMAEPMATVVG